MSWPFSVEIKVRYSDLNVAGHVDNAVYFTYLGIASIEYYRHLTNIEKLADLVFASASCSFKNPAFMGETVIVYIKPANVGESSWAFEYELREKTSGRLIAEAETVQVAFDYKKNKKKIIDDTLKQKLLSEIARSR